MCCYWHLVTLVKIQRLWKVGGQGVSVYTHQSMTANKDIIYVLFATKVWEQGRHTVMLFAVFIPFHTHKQHPALCSPLLLLREDVGWILTFRCTPLPHKHSLTHRYACAALSFGARGLGAGFSPDSMPPTWKSTCSSPSGTSVRDTLAVERQILVSARRRDEQSLSCHSEKFCFRFFKNRCVTCKLARC